MENTLVEWLYKITGDAGLSSHHNRPSSNALIRVSYFLDTLGKNDFAAPSGHIVGDWLFIQDRLGR